MKIVLNYFLSVFSAQNYHSVVKNTPDRRTETLFNFHWTFKVLHQYLLPFNSLHINHAYKLYIHCISASIYWYIKAHLYPDVL